jgi:hypothetical protein
MGSPRPSPGVRLRAEMWQRGFLRVQTLPSHRPNLLNREPVPPASKCKPGSTSHAAGSCLLRVLPAFAHQPPLQSPPLPSLRPDGPRPTRASGCMVPSYFPRSAWPEIGLRHIHGLPWGRGNRLAGLEPAWLSQAAPGRAGPQALVGWHPFESGEAQARPSPLPSPPAAQRLTPPSADEWLAGRMSPCHSAPALNLAMLELLRASCLPSCACVSGGC